MLPVATDGVAWFFSYSVGHDREPCKSSWTVLDFDSGGPKEPWWGSRSPHMNGQFWRQKWGDPGMSGGRYTQSDSAEAEPVRCICQLGCTRWGSHWRHLANTIEPYVCSSDPALPPYVK